MPSVVFDVGNIRVSKISWLPSWKGRNESNKDTKEWFAKQHCEGTQIGAHHGRLYTRLQILTLLPLRGEVYVASPQIWVNLRDSLVPYSNAEDAMTSSPIARQPPRLGHKKWCNLPLAGRELTSKLWSLTLSCLITLRRKPRPHGEFTHRLSWQPTSTTLWLKMSQVVPVPPFRLPPGTNFF